MGTSTKTGKSWRKLTRRDLANFDDHATTVVLEAMDRGGEGRISSNGHAILRNRGGNTMSVTPDSRHSKQVIEQRLRRYFPEQRKATGPSPQPAEPEVVLPPPANLGCPAKHCTEGPFATEGARYSHIEKAHVKCREPGCDPQYVGTPSGLVTHRRLAHEGWKPRQGTGKRHQEAPREGVFGDTPAQLPDYCNAASPDAPLHAYTGDDTPLVDVPVAPRPGYLQERVQELAGQLDAVRDALGVDPRIEELEVRVLQLESELADTTKRADEAEARLALLREALEA